ncbi:MAG: acetyl-CoA carboxylase biotin carboxyl carrier protein subunit [Deltaproteobacteria bacterium]|nr:acetyl-CoA carboxylase biotin carboxyl carrier protein subunit [Deltaproteobacteria bacterium]
MEKSINAIMPGLCARVVVAEGDKISKSQEIAVINCMKTEISVPSEYNGVVKKIISKEWDELQVGDPMIIIETAE